MCTEAGCPAKSYARGLCRQHHTALVAADPRSRSEVIRDKVKAMLPARQSVIVAHAGLHSSTVKRILDELHAAGQIHIGEHLPPVRPGDKFWPVFYLGPGEDDVITRKMKREHLNRVIRNGHHRRKAQRDIKKLPPGAGWAATLLIGI